MIVMPARLVERVGRSLKCRLGSEPKGDAPVELIPEDCIVRVGEMEGTDLVVLVVDESKMPETLRRAAGVN